MKKLFIPMAIGLSAMTLLSGCAFQLGSGTTTKVQNATLGQQLVDLKKAKDAGAITDVEYDTQKNKLLAH
jgi:hypothetical protein